MARFKNVAAMVALLAITILAFGNANAGVYVGGGTVVYKEKGAPPAADNGTLVCHSTGLAVGGGCIPFGLGNFVDVLDVAAGRNVAFQVCIDASGDGVCTDLGERPQDPCADRVFFSHDDEGLFHNPIGPLPSSMPAGCGATAPWQGYVVFLCEGVHVAGGSAGAPVGPGEAHAHAATIGTITPTGDLPPSGFGNFCGTNGRREPVSKPYTVIG